MINITCLIRPPTERSVYAWQLLWRQINNVKIQLLSDTHFDDPPTQPNTGLCCVFVWHFWRDVYDNQESLSVKRCTGTARATPEEHTVQYPVAGFFTLMCCVCFVAETKCYTHGVEPSLSDRVKTRSDP